MTRLWDSTLYVESHYPAFSLLPKCLECFDLWVPMAHRGVVLSSTATARLPCLPAPLVFALPVAADLLSWAPATANVPPLAALPELGLVGWSRPRLPPAFVPKIAPRH